MSYATVQNLIDRYGEERMMKLHTLLQELEICADAEERAQSTSA